MKAEEILEFERLYFEFSIYGSQRYGQAFCNHFNITDAKLFYEENTTIARGIVWAKYAE